MKNEILDNQLFWEKWRPKSLTELIIPDRIKKIAEKGIQGNYIFFGNSGCGKSSLARILLQEYPNSHLTLSSKLGVDELRGRVERFCKEMIPFEDPNKLRVVYFEEFDRASSQLQDELKSFIEDHSKRVRFLATCNNIQKIKEPIRSRFIEVDFTLIGEETKIIKTEFALRVLEILKIENINIEKDILRNIINNRCPDFRKVWQDIQYYHLSGVNNTNIAEDTDTKLFEIILNKKNNIDSWDYLAANWMDKPDIAFLKLGRDFFIWIKSYYPEKITKLGNHLIILSDYTDSKLPNSLDPFITLNALIFKLQELYEK